MTLARASAPDRLVLTSDGDGDGDGEAASNRLSRLLAVFRESGGFRSGPDALRLWGEIQQTVREMNGSRG